MKTIHKLYAVTLALSMAITLVAWWQTQPREPGPGAPVAARAEDAPADYLDQSLYTESLRLAPLANGAKEQAYSQSALRIADHEIDLAVAGALLYLDAHPPELSSAASQIQARLKTSEELYQADQRTVTELTAATAAASGQRKNDLQDDLDLAQSQLELDQDEVGEASQDLLDAGANPQRRIQALVQQHQAAAQAGAAPASAAGASPFADLRGLVHQFRFWLSLQQKDRLLADAQTQASAHAVILSQDRQRLASGLERSKAGIAALAHHTKQARDAGVPRVQAQPRSHADAATLVRQAQQIASDQKVVGFLDQRVADLQELASVYQQWRTVSLAQTRAAAHELLAGALIIIAALLSAQLLGRWLRRSFGQTHADRRQVETLRSVARVSLQILAVLIVLFTLIGLPNQFGTILGIVGAGLTVALKDFIVAFIGWLALMGKNGIRVGDWVEINGVSGEVIELGVFHTVLLETGSWSDAGHPTGRRVTFTNSFAIEGHYFNFSTSGQWLWDELQVVIPVFRDPYPIFEAIKQQVQEATAENARVAEQEWQGAVPAQRGRTFSGAPGINLKPVVGGVEIAVRYITRAQDRFLLRAKLYQSAVDLLGEEPAARPTA